MAGFYLQDEGGAEGGYERGDEGGYEGDEIGYEGDEGDYEGDESGYDGGDESGYEGGDGGAYEGGESESIGTFGWTGELSGNGPSHVEDSGNAPINLDNSVVGNDNVNDASTPSNDPIEGNFEETSDSGNITGDLNNSTGFTSSRGSNPYRESNDSVSWGAVATIDPTEGSLTIPITPPEIGFIGPDLSITFFTGERAPSLSIGMGIGIPFTVGFKFGVKIGHDNGVYGGVNALGFNQEATIDYGSMFHFLVHYSNAGGPFGPNSYSSK